MDGFCLDLLYVLVFRLSLLVAKYHITYDRRTKKQRHQNKGIISKLENDYRIAVWNFIDN